MKKHVFFYSSKFLQVHFLYPNQVIPNSDFFSIYILLHHRSTLRHTSLQYYPMNEPNEHSYTYGKEQQRHLINVSNKERRTLTLISSL